MHLSRGSLAIEHSGTKDSADAGRSRGFSLLTNTTLVSGTSRGMDLGSSAYSTIHGRAYWQNKLKIFNYIPNQSN
jgi:hypothetical protein